jgi:carbonic anhydrase/acetyltransferase-like protein (isoleucine patch superfamily)
MIRSFEGKRPDISKAAFVAASADVTGEVELMEGSSVWYGAVLRADLAPIKVGAGSNVQDGVVAHVDEDHPCVLGEDVTVGHRAVLHGCSVGDRCLVGMGAVLLDGSVIGEECIVGAGALVTQGKSFPPRSLILGSPAKVARELRPDEVAGLREHARSYVELARRTASGSRNV